MANSQGVADEMPQDTMLPIKVAEMHLFCIVFTNKTSGNKVGILVCI